MISYFTTGVSTPTSLIVFCSGDIFWCTPQTSMDNLFEEMGFIVEVNEVEIVMVVVGIETVEMIESH